jgi:ABC-type bacteriocin/lantibiotic exporter with double-glycine peptidase domain
MARVQENRKIERFLTGEALSIVLDLLTVFIYSNPKSFFKNNCIDEF